MYAVIFSFGIEQPSISPGILHGVKRRDYGRNEMKSFSGARQAGRKATRTKSLRSSGSIVSKREQRQARLSSAEREQCLCIARACSQADEIIPFRKGRQSGATIVFLNVNLPSITL